MFKFEIKELELDITAERDPKDCKGLIFRGYRNAYAQGAEYHIKKGFRLLKRKSCPGCAKCGFFSDDINEMIDSNGLIIPDIENGALYSIRVTNIGTDWESGLVDSWDYEFFKVDEKEIDKKRR
jgi:hypothetical protein